MNKNFLKKIVKQTIKNISETVEQNDFESGFDEEHEKQDKFKQLIEDISDEHGRRLRAVLCKTLFENVETLVSLLELAEESEELQFEIVSNLENVELSIK